MLKKEEKEEPVAPELAELAATIPESAEPELEAEGEELDGSDMSAIIYEIPKEPEKWVLGWAGVGTGSSPRAHNLSGVGTPMPRAPLLQEAAEQADAGDGRRWPAGDVPLPLRGLQPGLCGPQQFPGEATTQVGWAGPTSGSGCLCTGVWAVGLVKGPTRHQCPASQTPTSQQLLTDPTSATERQGAPGHLPFLLSSPHALPSQPA